MKKVVVNGTIKNSGITYSIDTLIAILLLLTFIYSLHAYTRYTGTHKHTGYSCSLIKTNSLDSFKPDFVKISHFEGSFGTFLIKIRRQNP